MTAWYSQVSISRDTAYVIRWSVMGLHAYSSRHCDGNMKLKPKVREGKSVQ